MLLNRLLSDFRPSIIRKDLEIEETETDMSWKRTWQADGVFATICGASAGTTQCNVNADVINKRIRFANFCAKRSNQQRI